MPEGGSKEVNTTTHDRIFFAALIVLTLLAFTLRADAQVLRQGDTEAIVAPLGIPCEPGDMTFGFYPCPPVASQGVLVHVRADGWAADSFDAYAVTVNYRTAAGEKKSATLTVKRERDFGKDWDDGWRAVGFNIGRVAVGPLSGITVESVAVAKVPAPVVITVGRTDIGAPK